MELVASGSILAFMAGLVLVWTHEVLGAVWFDKMRGFRYHLSEVTYQRLVLAQGVVLLLAGVAALALSPRS